MCWPFVIYCTIIPAATLLSLLLSSNSRPLSIQWLPDIAFGTFTSLGLAAELRTRRSYPEGVSARRVRDAKTFLPLGLINAISITSKAARIYDYLVTADLDVLAITETWLTDCSAGYSLQELVEEVVVLQLCSRMYSPLALRGPLVIKNKYLLLNIFLGRCMLTLFTLISRLYRPRKDAELPGLEKVENLDYGQHAWN